MKSLVPLREDVIRVWIESHPDVPVRALILAPDAEHPPEHHWVAGNQFIGSDAREGSY